MAAFDMFGVLRENRRAQVRLDARLYDIQREYLRQAEKIRQQKEMIHREVLESQAYLRVYKRYNFEALQADAESAPEQQPSDTPTNIMPSNTRSEKKTDVKSSPFRADSDPFHLKDIHRFDDHYPFGDTPYRTVPKRTAAELPAVREPISRRLDIAAKFPAIWKSRDKTFYEEKKERLLSQWRSPETRAKIIYGGAGRAVSIHRLPHPVTAPMNDVLL